MIKSKLRFEIIIIFFLSILKIHAQDVLTAENAVKIALENNYEIKIASNNLTIDRTNVSSGNAGMLPVITATVIDNNRIQNS